MQDLTVGLFLKSILFSELGQVEEEVMLQPRQLPELHVIVDCALLGVIFPQLAGYP